MGTTLETFVKRILTNLNRSDGIAHNAAVEAVNEALIELTRRYDFDELKTETDAYTVANQKSYHLEDDLGLSRVKDIYSVRYIDGSSSRKLIYIPVREWDAVIPYPEQHATGKPSYYTLRGKYIELFKIPSTSGKILRIYHSNWPERLTDDSDESPFGEEMDEVIVSVATAIAQQILEGEWAAYALEKLAVTIKEEYTQPDKVWRMRPFDPYTKVAPGVEYWTNPWIKRQP